MCSTCGCEANGNEVLIQLPEDVETQNTNGHHHHHDHEAHHHHHHDHDHSHTSTIDLEMDILSQNNLMAERNRGYFEAKNILALNMVSSPGSGKTSLIEATIKALKDDIDIYVIEGDQQTMNDANRIKSLGVPVVQINTGKGCHLDADMVHKAILKLNPSNNSLLIIENVGNLVCPAMFDLGESSRVVVMSVTEGADKPIKYPDMFASSSLCLINKIDLIDYVPFDIEESKNYASKVNYHLDYLELSALKGNGMDKWCHWIKEKVHMPVA